MLYIPVGIPGCGKSTFANTLIRNAVVHSTDAIRDEITGDVNSQDQNKRVFYLFHDRITQDLKKHYYVYADATNLRDFAREKLRAIAAECGQKTHLIVFTNNHQAIVRNQRRERRVPDDVMERMIAQYEQALKDILTESYDSITYIESVS